MRILAVLALLTPPAAAQTALEREVLEEINFARTSPREYAQDLSDYRSFFDGKVARIPGNPIGLLTAEGVHAVDEAIAFLLTQPPLPPLESSTLLARAAYDHVVEQGPRGGIGHYARTGSGPADRVQNRGGGRTVGEVITYGSATAIDVVRQLIVDDAVPGRGHRRALFAKTIRYAGIGCGPHLNYRKMCVADLSATPDAK